MQLDFKAIQENVDRHNAEKAQAFNDRFQNLREKQQAHDEEINRLLAASASRESERKRQEMESKIQEEIAAASEAIREKYAKESPAEWNEGKVERALKKLAKSFSE